MTPLHDDPFAELGNGRTFIKPTPGAAGTDLKWERRRGRLAAAGYALVAVVTLTAAAVWGTSLPSPDEFASMLEGRW